MAWHRQFLACGFLWVLPSSIELSSPIAPRGTKRPRFFSLRGEAVRAFVPPLDVHLESSGTLTSHSLPREDVSLGVRRLVIRPPDP